MTAFGLRVQQVIPAPRPSRRWPRLARLARLPRLPRATLSYCSCPTGWSRQAEQSGRAVRQANPQPASSVLDLFPPMTAYPLPSQGRRGSVPNRSGCQYAMKHAAAVQNAYTTIITIYEPASPNTLVCAAFCSSSLTRNYHITAFPLLIQPPFKICFCYISLVPQSVVPLILLRQPQAGLTQPFTCR